MTWDTVALAEFPSNRLLESVFSSHGHDTPTLTTDILTRLSSKKLTSLWTDYQQQSIKDNKAILNASTTSTQAPQQSRLSIYHSQRASLLWITVCQCVIPGRGRRLMHDHELSDEHLRNYEWLKVWVARLPVLSSTEISAGKGHEHQRASWSNQIVSEKVSGSHISCSPDHWIQS